MRIISALCLKTMWILTHILPLTMCFRKSGRRFLKRISPVKNHPRLLVHFMFLEKGGGALFKMELMVIHGIFRPHYWKMYTKGLMLLWLITVLLPLGPRMPLLLEELEIIIRCIPSAHLIMFYMTLSLLAIREFTSINHFLFLSYQLLAVPTIKCQYLAIKMRYLIFNL